MIRGRRAGGAKPPSEAAKPSPCVPYIGARKGGVWRSICAGLLIGFLCWVALSASLALGKKGLLPPLLAAWLPGALFAATGALLLRGTPR